MKSEQKEVTYKYTLVYGVNPLALRINHVNQELIKHDYDRVAVIILFCKNER